MAREHRDDGFFLIDGRFAVPAALGVDGERQFQLVREPEVVDHEATGLVFEDPVHARWPA